VPQHPPHMSICGCCRARSPMSSPSTTGSPTSRCPSVHSEILSINAALGRRQHTRSNHWPDSIAGVNSSGCEQLMHRAERYRFDQVNPGTGQGGELFAVVLLRLLSGDRLVGLVRVSARADDAGVQECRHLPRIRLGDLVQEVDRSQLHLGQRLTGVTQQGGPVRARAVVEPADAHAEPVVGGGIEIPVVHPSQLGHGARVVEQWKTWRSAGARTRTCT
jgi:hypothetical protein